MVVIVGNLITVQVPAPSSLPFAENLKKGRAVQLKLVNRHLLSWNPAREKWQLCWKSQKPLE
jgi:hypothetical protein